MAANNINLTVSVDRVEGVDAASRYIHDRMSNASGEAGRDSGDRFVDEFTRTIANQDGKVARAFDRTVNAISRVTELEQRLNNQREITLTTSERMVDAENRLNEMRSDATASAADLAAAEERAAAARLEHNSAMNRQITTSSQLTRANKEHASAIDAVIRAQDSLVDEDAVGQGLLTIGKYVSALRAVAIPALGLVGGAIGANIAAVTAAAAQGLWMIPAAAGAATAGIATMSVATMGFGDAIKDIGDPEKFATALQSLSPNAQQAALSIQALMEPLTAMKQAVQDALFADFGPMLNELANQYLPTVQNMMTGIAGAFNTAASSLFDTLMNPETQQVLSNTMNSLVQAFQNLAPAAGPFFDAMARIVETGASYLPQLAEGAARAASEFAVFINSAQASGDLSRWFEEGLETLSQLWDGIKMIGQAFMDLAPAGREHLPQILELLENMATTLPPLLTGLANLITPFAEIAQASNSMWEIVGAVFGRFEGAANGVSGAIEMIKSALKGLIGMIPGLGPGLQMLERFNSLFEKLPGVPGGGRGQTPNAVIIPSGDPGLLGGGGLFSSDASGSGGLLGAGGSGDMGVGLANRSGAPAVGPLSTTDIGGGGLLGGGSGLDASQGDVGGPGLGLLPNQPTAGLPGFPAGGYAVPPPPAPKGGGGGGSQPKAPPFTADPSLYSVDAIPVTPVAALPDGLASQSGLVPNARNLNDIITALFPQMPSAGGWRPPDGYNEHSIGEAVDFMTGTNMALGDSINQFILQNAKALGVQYTLWRQMQFYADGRVVPMPDRGDPTQNHMDHVHARVLPGEAKAGGIATPMQASPDAQAGMYGSLPAAMNVVDPEQVMRAEMALQTARENVEEKRLRLLELEAKGTASQRELMTARNNVRQAEDNYRLKDLELAKARQGEYKQLDASVSSSARNVSQGLSEIGASLAGDFGLSEGLPGIAKWFTTFLANMAFAPMMGALSAVSAANPIQGGHGMLGMMGARNIAAGGSPLGFSAPGMAPMLGAPGMAGIGAPMMGGLPMMGGPQMMGPAPLGGGLGAPLPGAGMPGVGVPHGMGGMPGPATAQTSQAPQMASPGGGFAGVGGLPLEAAMTATAGLDLLAPGASQAAQMGMKLANRTAGYIGQLGAIGVGGLMETFLPNNSALADPSKSWLGRIAAGVAGARPATPNAAGQTAPAATPMPEQQAQNGQGGPMVNVENLNNYSTDGGQSVANQIGRHQMSAYAAGGPR